MLAKYIIVALVVICILNYNGVLAATTTTSTTEASKNSTNGKQILKALPDGIPSCPNDANINECIRNTFNLLLKSSKNGIPEISVPPIDPLVQEKIKIEFSNNVIRGKALARHVQIYGFSESIIDKSEYFRNGTKFMLKMRLKNPKLKINGKYKAQIQWNASKLPNSQGVFNITISDLSVNTHHYAELYERDGETFVKVTKIDLDPTLSGMQISATGLVPEPALNDALLEVLNENWRSVSQSVLPAIHSTMEQLIIRYSNAILGRLPFKLIVT